MSRNIAIIGAGWAGLTCALELTAAGLPVTVFETNAIAGGRARRIVSPDGIERDNGQHLLLGAYTQALKQIAQVNPTKKIDALLQRVPLTLSQRARIGDHAHFSFCLPQTPVIHGALALLKAYGLAFSEKKSLAVYFARVFLKINESSTKTVAQDTDALSPTVRDRLIAPLCLAALNTPMERASAMVFRNVLRASFTISPKSADMLIPRVDLSALFADPALEMLRTRGAQVCLKETVFHVKPTDEGRVEVVTRHRTASFSDCVLAVPPYATSRLLESFPGCGGTVRALSDLIYEPITTIWQTSPPATPASPIFNVDDPELQWVVHHPTQNFRTIVVSGIEANQENDIDAKKNRLAHKLATAASALVAVTERRATYSCTPQQCIRLQTLPPVPRPLWLAGDYRYPQFPATLEAAVRSGQETANAIIQSIR